MALVLQALVQVGDKWRAQESEEPPLCIVSAQTGGRVRLGLVDEGSGALVPYQDLRVEAGPGADDLMRWRLARRKE